MSAEPVIAPEPLLPSDTDAEQAVLGSILLEPGACSRAFAIVSPDDFYRTYHKQIAAAAFACYQRREPVDCTTVGAELRRRKHLEEIGGGEYLTALIGMVPTAAHVSRYANIVAEKSVLRQVAHRAEQIQQAAFSNPEDVGAFLADAGSAFQELYRERVAGGVLPELGADFEQQVSDLYADLYAETGPVSDARLGIGAIDRQNGGLAHERLVIIKADTKHGKSQILRQAMVETARQIKDTDKLVLGFILEEGKRAWWRKTISHLSGVDSRILLRRGWGKRYFEQHPDDDEKVTAALSELVSLPLKVSFLCDDITQIEIACRTIAQEQEIALVGIDYFQLMTGGAAGAYSEEQEYTARAKRLQKLADELAVPIVVPSQITEDKATKRRNTKGARGIEVNASLVLDWRREEVAGVKQDRGFLACLIARNGPGFGLTELITDMKCGRYWDAEEYRQMKYYEEQQRQSESEE